MILGLDISTSVIGYAILDDNGKLKRIGYLNISGAEDVFDKANITYQYFELILEDYKIDSIFIEDISKKFSPGFSSAQIITLLAKFNGIVSYIFNIITKIKPQYIVSISARKIAYNRPFKRGKDVKQQVYNEVMKREDIKWPITEKGKLLNGVFDAADAYTLALAGFKIEQDKIGTSTFRENKNNKSNIR